MDQPEPVEDLSLFTLLRYKYNNKYCSYKFTFNIENCFILNSLEKTHVTMIHSLIIKLTLICVESINVYLIDSGNKLKMQ